MNINLLSPAKLIKILDPKSTGSIDIQNLVNSTQKYISKQIPNSQRPQITKILKNFVYKYKTFSMPLRLFYKHYKRSFTIPSKIKDQNPQSKQKSSSTPRVKLVLNQTSRPPLSTKRAQKRNQTFQKPSTPQARQQRKSEEGYVDISKRKFQFKESFQIKRITQSTERGIRQRKWSDPFMIKYNNVQSILDIRKQHLEYSRRTKTTKQFKIEFP